MLTCITCAKQVTEEEKDGDEGGAHGGTPRTKEAVKSLSSQIKDMALKVSGAYRHSKPSTGSSVYKRGTRSYPDFDTISEGAPYPCVTPGSSASTPAWDFTSTGNLRSTVKDSRFTGALNGDRTDRGPGTMSGNGCNAELESGDEPKEWMAQVEPGVHITFASLPNGGNDLKRIRFSREMFDKWQAQRWWGENYDRIMELYNVQRFNRQSLQTPARSEDGRDSSFSRMGSERESPMTQPYTTKEWIQKPHYKPSGGRGFFPPELDQSSSHYYNGGSSAYGVGGPKGEASSMDASRTTTDSRDDASVSVSNASDMESEWIEQDEPGVYITIRQLADGTRELRRVRFSRETFGEVHAKQWWEENRERIQAQYL